MQVTLELLSPEIVSTLKNKELPSHFRVDRKITTSAETNGRMTTDGPLYNGSVVLGKGAFCKSYAKYLAHLSYKEFILFKCFTNALRQNALIFLFVESRKFLRRDNTLLIF